MKPTRAYFSCFGETNFHLRDLTVLSAENAIYMYEDGVGIAISLRCMGGIFLWKFFEKNVNIESLGKILSLIILSEKTLSFVGDDISEKNINLGQKQPKIQKQSCHNFLTSDPIPKQKTSVKIHEKSRKLSLLLFSPCALGSLVAREWKFF